MSHPESHHDQSQQPEQPPRQTRREREAQANLILDWVGEKLLDVAPPEWRKLDLKVTMASTVDDFTFATVMYDGTANPVEMPMEIRRAFVDLRELLYEPELGTWFSVRFVMDPPDHYKVSFNFDVDPVWDPPVAAAVYAKDLEAFPRSPEHIPAWLRAKLNSEGAV